MKTFLAPLFVAFIAAFGGWWCGARHEHSPGAAPPAAAKKILYYQSTMHPWVKSDKPGKCTVCGMELAPVYEGGQSHDSAKTDVVMLPEGSPSISAIKTAEVKRQPLARTLRVAGMIDDNDSTHRVLSAYTSGRIEKIFVNFEGAEVQAGHEQRRRENIRRCAKARLRHVETERLPDGRRRGRPRCSRQAVHCLVVARRLSSPANSPVRKNSSRIPPRSRWS